MRNPGFFEKVVMAISGTDTNLGPPAIAFEMLDHISLERNREKQLQRFRCGTIPVLEQLHGQ